MLDVAELTVHADNAIKFLSDMYVARLYKLAAAKVGVPDYKDLVAQKLRTAEELYDYMVEQFNQSRAFFLEVTAGLGLFMELLYLPRSLRPRKNPRRRLTSSACFGFVSGDRGAVAGLMPCSLG